MSQSTFNQSNKNSFLQAIELSVQDKSIVNLVLLNNKNDGEVIKKIAIRPIMLKKGLMLSFVKRFQGNDITKNYSIPTALRKIRDLIENTFCQAILSTVNEEYFLTFPEKGRSKLKKKQRKVEDSFNTNLELYKNRPITRQQNYLTALGVLNENGTVFKDKQVKYKQIKKFIEIIEPIIDKSELDEKINIVDMGSGKGYLSFALYDHLKNKKGYKTYMTGIELRTDLVSFCNNVAVNIGFENLIFKEGSIETTPIDNPDILIALHACNTATDDAIAKGIHSQAKIIICSPCCHKQIRKQMSPVSEINSISQFGILKERMAEIVTDSIRALILKSYGYKTNVMEFIATSHTPKNLLITAIKVEEVSKPSQKHISEIDTLKKLFGINEHHLEKLTINRK